MTVYDFDVLAIDGSPRHMADYQGHTLLIVNVASRCGYTPQYAGLEALFRRYQDRGLVVLGFPCDQFGHQEPGTEAEIRQFCSRTYDVTFPLFSKIKVNGEDAAPLYKFLKQARKGVLGSEGIKWNFTKFLVGPDGQVHDRFAPTDTPEVLEPEILRWLPPTAHHPPR
jgi:glutathione peroxidase